MLDIQHLLTDFEDIIVSRGKSYFHNGHVIDLKETAPDAYTARVKGTQTYTVSIKPDKHGRIAYDCTCAYWNAPHCKHVVATLLAIEDMHTERQPAMRIVFHHASDDGVLSTDALNALPKAQLIALIQDISRADLLTADWFRARLSAPEDAIAAYQQLIRDRASAFTTHGWIAYNDIDNALFGASQALDALRDMIPSAPVAQILAFAQMVIRETIRLESHFKDIDESDDEAWDRRNDWSVDSIGALDIIDGCVDALADCLERRVLPADDATKETHFRALFAFAQSKQFHDGLDERDKLVAQCIRIADDLPALRAPLLQWAEANAAATNGRYNQAREQEAYFALLLRWESEDAARAYAETCPDNDTFHVYFFEQALAREQYTQALQLCLRAEETCPFTQVQAWQTRRYALYETLGDRDAQKELGATLLQQGAIPYYDRLKALYSAEEWPAARRTLLDQLKADHLAEQTYQEIITAEDDKPRIIEHVRLRPTRVFALYRYLLPDYANEVRNLFCTALHTIMSYASDRTAYRNVCDHIRIFQKACGTPDALAFIETLRKIYPRKRALQEELQKTAARMQQ